MHVGGLFCLGCGRAPPLPRAQVVFVGDGNNIVHSWLRFAAKVPIELVNICPPGYEPDSKTVERARAGGVSRITISHDLNDVKGADVIYTDVWASMGQKDTFEQRKKDFAVRGPSVASRFPGPTSPSALGNPDGACAPSMRLQGYTVDKAMMAKTNNALFMHCLPAERGFEVSDEVIESPNSVVFPEAENRMWAQMSVCLYALGMLS